MPLSVDPRKILKVEALPWKRDQRLYGVAYETNDGWKGFDFMGTKEEAEKIIQYIEGRRFPAYPPAGRARAKSNLPHALAAWPRWLGS